MKLISGIRTGRMIIWYMMVVIWMEYNIYTVYSSCRYVQLNLIPFALDTCMANTYEQTFSFKFACNQEKTDIDVLLWTGETDCTSINPIFPLKKTVREILDMLPKSIGDDVTITFNCDGDSTCASIVRKYWNNPGNSNCLTTGGGKYTNYTDYAYATGVCTQYSGTAYQGTCSNNVYEGFYYTGTTCDNTELYSTELTSGCTPQYNATVGINTYWLGLVSCSGTIAAESDPYAYTTTTTSTTTTTTASSSTTEDSATSDAITISPWLRIVHLLPLVAFFWLFYQ